MDKIKRCRSAEALSAYAAGRHSAAETVCVRILMNYPNDPDLLHLLGLARLAHGTVIAAIEAPKAACAHAPITGLSSGNGPNLSFDMINLLRVRIPDRG